MGQDVEIGAVKRASRRVAVAARETHIKDRIREQWTRSSPRYDSQPGHGIHSEKEKQAWIGLLAQAVGTRKPLKVLDVGTGTGVMAFLLAEMGHQVVGVDLTPAMLQKAQEKAKALPLSVHFQLGDAEELPFDNGTFDVVISRHVLFSLPHPEQAVRGWWRVLKNGGMVVAIDGNWTKRWRIGFRLWRVFAWLLVLLTERRNLWRRWYGRRPLEELPLRKANRPEADVELLRTAGFNGIEVARIDHRVHSWWYRLKYGHNGAHFLVKAVKG